MADIPLADPDFAARRAPLGPDSGPRIWPLESVNQIGEPRFSERVEAVVGETPLVDVDYGRLHAYMTCRFGPAHLGGDPVKHLAGGWMLTTPEPDMVMIVRPSPFSRGEPWMVEGDLRAHVEGDVFDLAENVPEDDVRRWLRAYDVALRDLLRPVQVRDMHVNALGPLERDDPLLDADEEGTLTHVAPRAASGSFGMPVDLVEGGHYADLLGVIDMFGGPVEGARRSVSSMRWQSARDLANEPDPVRKLVAFALHASGESAHPLLSTVGDRASRDGLRLAEVSSSHDPGLLLDFPDFDPAHVRRAQSLLSGHGAGVDVNRHLWEVWNFRRACRIVDARERAARRDGAPFPADMLPERPGGGIGFALSELPDRLRARGMVATADWIAGVLESEGEKELRDCLEFLTAQRREKGGVR